MSAQEVETMIRSLSPGELTRFAEWWDAHREALLNQTPGAAEAVEGPVRMELQRRRQEYIDHPERFVSMNDAEMDRMFRDIENEDS